MNKGQNRDKCNLFFLTMDFLIWFWNEDDNSYQLGNLISGICLDFIVDSYLVQATIKARSVDEIDSKSRRRQEDPRNEVIFVALENYDEGKVEDIKD